MRTSVTDDDAEAAKSGVVSTLLRVDSADSSQCRTTRRERRATARVGRLAFSNTLSKRRYAARLRLDECPAPRRLFGQRGRTGYSSAADGTVRGVRYDEYRPRGAVQPLPDGVRRATAPFERENTSQRPPPTTATKRMDATAADGHPPAVTQFGDENRPVVATVPQKSRFASVSTTTLR